MYARDENTLFTLNQPVNIISHNMLDNDHKKYLLDRGIAEKIAFKYGFFTASPEESQNLIGQRLKGLAIPYYDINKIIVSHRLRPLKNDWHSNKELKDFYLDAKGELPKFLSKSKGESIEEQRINKAYFPPCLEWTKIQQKSSIDILITEGEIKALSASLLGVPTIAISGVNNIYNKITVGKEQIREFLPDLEWDCDEEYRKSYWQGRNVGLCFDSDIVSKWQVQRALTQLAKEIKTRGGNPFLVLLPTEANGEKNGLDDFLVRHGADALKRLIEQFKILQKSKSKLLIWDNQEKQYDLGDLEPIASIKGLMAWSCLKDNLAYREGYGWYEWNGKYWKLVSESKIMGALQDFRYANQWLNLNDKTVFEDFKGGLSKSEVEFNQSNILGFNNGYLNTDTNTFCPHDKRYYVTSILPFDYNPEASCDTWLNFLKQSLGGDTQKIEYARAWLRWILTPKGNNKFPIEATLWIVGKQGTGKGTFLNILSRLVGEDNYGVFTPEAITDTNMLFGLVDKKLAVNQDVTGFISNIGVYNRICSNELVNVWNKYHNQFSTRLNTVTVLAMNKPLSFSGNGSEGLKRRLHVLTFDHQPKEADFDLSEKLESELSGIFSWVWGLSLTDTKQKLKWRDTQATAEIYESQLTELLFLRETFPDGCNHIIPSELYHQFAEWCKTNGYGVSNSQNFYLSLKKIDGIDQGRTREGRFYSIPPMENYQDDSFKNTETLTTTGRDGCDGCDTSPVTGSNPYTVRRVTGVTGLTQKFSDHQEKNELTTKTLPDQPVTPVTIQSQQGFQPVTKPVTETKTRHAHTQQWLQPIQLVSTEALLQKLETIDNDLLQIFNNATSEKEITNNLLAKWKSECDRLGKNKEWSREKFKEVIGLDDPRSANYCQWLDFIAYLRKQKVAPKPKKVESPKKQVKKFIPKPEAPEVNLSDVLPHLEQGTGKHKRNYVCPCCKKDYLSVNPGKGFKCWNKETNCDSKEIFKGFVEILKEHDPTWQQYERDIEQWQAEINGGGANG